MVHLTNENGLIRNPAAMWQALAQQHIRQSESNVMRLKEQFHAAKMTPPTSIQQHIRDLKNITNQLRTLGQRIDDKELQLRILGSLPETYNTIVTSIKTQPAGQWHWTTADIENQLLQVPIPAPNESNTAFQAARERETRKCFNCNKIGHLSRDCRAPRRPRPNHHASPAEHNDEEWGLCATTTPTNDTWLIDSGATSHMSANKQNFTNYESLPTPITITIANGTTIQAIGRGSIKLLIDNHPMAMHKVLYVPQLTTNLFSLQQATAPGATILFQHNTMQLRKNNITKTIGIRQGNKYILNITKEQAYVAIPGDVLHKRIGHLSKSNMLILEHTADGFNIPQQWLPTTCEPCCMGHHARTPFGHSSHEATELLEVITSDIGCIEVASLSGKRYFITFIDAFSRYICTYFLNHKSEAFTKFTEYRTYVEKLHGRPIKTLRTDNGGEYTSTAFTSYLKQHGIHHQLTIPHTPQQNGICERANRTLMEATRAIMHDAKTPKFLWAEALNCITYLRNRSPTRCKPVTPYELWSGHRPNLAHLRIFGCTAYAHIPDALCRKLDAKSTTCIFVGYDNQSKAYRLYDPKKNSIIRSRDVHFNENQMFYCRGHNNNAREHHDTSNDTNHNAHDNNGNLKGNNNDINENAHDNNGNLKGNNDDINENDDVNASNDISTDENNDNNATNKRNDNSNDDNDDNDDIHEHNDEQTSKDNDHDDMNERNDGQKNKDDINNDPADAILHGINEHRHNAKPERPEDPHDTTTSYDTTQTPRRSKRIALRQSAHMADTTDPKTYEEAINGPNKEKWLKAIHEELDALENNETWTEQPLPIDRKAVNTKWVFKTKRTSTNEISRYKARLCVQGFTQRYGIDYEETFAPVVNFTTIRTVLAIATNHNWDIVQCDIPNAYLKGTINHEIYLKTPKGYKGNNTKSLLLKKGLYGTKQGGFEWNAEIKQFLHSLGFKPSHADTCLFILKRAGRIIALILLYVDDLIITGPQQHDINDICNALKGKYC
jgi:Reverse transcriptase (RNA-dependent DNA polymerase)/gag-polypeptide of LTR copia-type/Integrase core domain/Zinc knuckle